MNRQFSSLTQTTLVAVGLLLLASSVAWAEQDANDTSGGLSADTCVLSCETEQSGIQLKVVKRDTLNRDIFVDVAGLRLYADNSASRRNAYGRLFGKISNHFYAQRFITDTLCGQPTRRLINDR